jgi:hypothetical protein
VVSASASVSQLAVVGGQFSGRIELGSCQLSERIHRMNVFLAQLNRHGKLRAIAPPTDNRQPRLTTNWYWH